MNLRELLVAARKRWWVIFAALVVTSSLAAFFASKREAVYEASATVALLPNPTQENVVSQDALSALLATYAQTAESQANRNRARTILGNRAPGELTASAEEGTGILKIFARSSSPEFARASASAAAQGFIDSVSDNRLLETQIVSAPVTPETAVQPRPPLIIGTGAILGLAFGLALALLLDRTTRRVDTSEELAESSALPLLARLPREAGLKTNRGIIWTSSEYSGMQEQFRALRTNIELLLEVKHPMIQVTSAMPGEGKSTVAANLALAFAQTGQDTLIVDGDLRRPIQHKLLEVDNRRGVTNLLAQVGRSEIDPVQTRYPLLYAIPSGPPVPNSTELMHGGFAATARKLREFKGMVIIDSPPLLPTSDPLLMAPHVDGVVVVIGAGDRRPSEIKEALERLEFAGAKVIGLVLNRSGIASTTGYGYRRDPERLVPGEQSKPRSGLRFRGRGS